MLWIDHRLMTSIGLTPMRLTGHLTAGGVTRARQPVPGRAGLLLGTRQGAEPAYIEIEAAAKLGAFTDRGALLGVIERAYGGGAIRTLRTMDRPDVLTRVVLDGPAQIREVAGAPGLTIPRLIVLLRFLRLDGGSLAWPAAGAILLGTTPTPIPLGSLPSGGTVLAWGGSSPLTITYTPATGIGATAWTITQALATGEHVAAEIDTGDVFHVAVSGTRTRVATVTGTAPALDPDDEAGTASPSLALSSGSGLLLPITRHRA